MKLILLHLGVGHESILILLDGVTPILFGPCAIFLVVLVFAVFLLLDDGTVGRVRTVGRVGQTGRGRKRKNRLSRGRDRKQEGN